MEDDFRSFEAVNIGLTSVETGRERFTRDKLYNPPPLALWRNNLTGLSQRFNLYFVASRDSIAVYKPDFPFHRLHRLPALLIPAYLANPDAEGYIDTRFPHAINHLVVGDLGSEEILLVSTDSGNVTAYYTRAVEEAIRKHPYRFSTDARSDYIGVNAFFAQWVHESAWGLSIHSRARMIAVSANTPWHCGSDDPCAKITVFAFALEGSGEDAEELDMEISDESGHARPADWRVWGVAQNTAPPLRNRNYKITLSGIDGHSNNIPSISFVSTNDDPDGLWLLSTGIGGEMKMWDIWRGICLKSWDFSAHRLRPPYLRPQEGGWLVAALDPAAFRSAPTMEQFCGYLKAPQYHGHVGESYDITHVVRLRTPGNSYTHPSMVEVDEETDDEDPELPLDSGSDVDEANIDTLQLQQNTTSLPVASLTTSAFPTEGSLSSSGSILAPNENSGVVAVAGPSTNSTQSELPEAHGAPVEDMLFEEGQPWSAQYEEEDVESQSSSGEQEQDGDLSSSSHHSVTSLSSFAHRNSQEIEVDIVSANEQDSPSRGRQRIEEPSLNPLGKARSWDVNTRRPERTVPAIPTLHCSASNIRLLFAPTSNTPHIFCANVLKQAMPLEFERTNLASLDRMNMFQQIPELGIVIVASQLGRCAVCTLTRYEKTGILGLRVDWTLPFKKQEIRKLRPSMPLLGIATSPVEGMFPTTPTTGDHGPETSANWGMNSKVDGISTTFDPSVVLVEEAHSRGRDGRLDYNEEDHFDTSEDGAERQMKRKRLGYDRGHSTSTKKRTVLRSWEVPTRPERWQAMEYTRRYRLMLTYADMTVMTYEISRGVERDDVRQDEVSHLELLD